VGPLLARTLHGAVANNYTFLRDERMVAYKPKLRYEGPDFFTYRIYDGQNVQEHSGGRPGALLAGGVSLNEVTLHVRSCRLFESATAKYESQLAAAADPAAFQKELNHPLCPCASTDNDIIGNLTECYAGYEKVCSNSATRHHFLNLCVICDQSPDSSVFSEKCTLEVIRAVSFVSQRGFCDAAPPMDCSSELVSLPGREAVNYLSLRPYSLHGAYTQLGSGYGGYGWYDSALYV
jgi:hypothetical protein